LAKREPATTAMARRARYQSVSIWTKLLQIQ
jgi:hypothetical protein